MQQKHRMLTHDPTLRSALVLQNPSLPAHQMDTPQRPGTVSGLSKTANEVRGNYHWRAVSERTLHKKPVTSKTVAAGAGARNWSCGPVMVSFVAIVDFD
jgi:hypothetical protein